jgi:pimeloyl-ACP methyl ester carboxylesterase
MPLLHAGDVDLYYEDAGDGSAVVYVHGGFASLDTTLQQLTPFDWSWENDFVDGGFHMVAYDRRGCYRSSCPDSGYDLPSQGRDLERLLDHLNVDAAHMIGSSAGGPISIVFAATHPERVLSLTLAGTALLLFPPDPITALVAEQAAILEREGPDAAFNHRPAGVDVTYKWLWEAEEMEQRGTLAEWQRQHQAWAEMAAALPRRLRVRYYAAELRNMAAYFDSVLPQARRVTAPALVLHGSNDREVPVAWGEELARAIPGARLHVVAGGGHTLVGRSAEARQVVIDFMRRH